MKEEISIPLGQTKEGMTPDTSKNTLEAAKLIEEINELRENYGTKKNEITQNSIRNWTGLAMGFVALLAAIGALYDQMGNYIAQRETESQLKINSDLIGLVNQLNSEAPIKQKEDAVILLSFYGEKISPILINQLNAQEDSAPNSELIIKALSMITDGKKKEKLKMQLLIIEEARKVFSNDIKDNLQSTTNFVDALCGLCTCKQIGEKLDSLKANISPHIKKGGPYKELMDKVTHCACANK